MNEAGDIPLLNNGDCTAPVLNVGTERRSSGNLFLRIGATIYIWIVLPICMMLAFIAQVRTNGVGGKLLFKIVGWLLLWPIYIASPGFRLGSQGRIFRFFQALGEWKVQ